MKNIILLIIILFAFNNCTVENNNIAVKDCACINPKLNFDTVKICNQVWMVKNLDVDHYRNGDSIPEITDSTQWAALTTGAWCYYNNDEENGCIYGKLYNWYAVNDPRGLAPDGWHVASNDEWTELVNCLGGVDVAGGKLKEAGIIHWLNPNIGASNENGFSALPGGWRINGGIFSAVNKIGIWWTTTTWAQPNTAHRWNLNFNDSAIQNFASGYSGGFSVRCIKD